MVATRQRPWLLGFVGAAVGLGQAPTAVPYLTGLAMLSAVHPRPQIWPLIVIVYCAMTLWPLLVILTLFTNPRTGNNAKGGPVRAPSFRANVWWPAVARADIPPPRPRIHDLRLSMST